MCLTFPGLSKELYYSRFALWFSSLPFPHFHLWCLSWSVLAQWCVSSNLSCPSKRSQDEMAGALGHQPLRYLNHQHLHNIQPRNTGEKSSQRTCNQREKSCINHDNTFGRQPPLHQWKKTGSRWGESSSQCGRIYYADVAWGLWGGRALASRAGSPANFPSKVPMACTQDFHDHSLTRSIPWRGAYVREKLELGPKNSHDRMANGDNIDKNSFFFYGVFKKSLNVLLHLFIWDS